MELAGFFVYLFYPGNANDSEHVLYVVGKIFSIGIQRHWDRGKRPGSYGEILELSWTGLLARSGRLCLISLISPLPPYGTSSSLLSMESYSQGASNRSSIMVWRSNLVEDFSKYRNSATFIILAILVTVKSGSLLSVCSPLYVECSPSVLHRFGWFLEGFWGGNMGFISRVSRVWPFLDWNGLVRMYNMYRRLVSGAY